MDAPMRGTLSIHLQRDRKPLLAQTGHFRWLSGGLTQRPVSVFLATFPRPCAQGF
jgi:hypothetical protein